MIRLNHFFSNICPLYSFVELHSVLSMAMENVFAETTLQICSHFLFNAKETGQLGYRQKIEMAHHFVETKPGTNEIT